MDATLSEQQPSLCAAQVFSEKKSLNLFQDKTLRIRRLYDSKRKTLVYVAYSTRLSTASVGLSCGFPTGEGQAIALVTDYPESH